MPSSADIIPLSQTPFSAMLPKKPRNADVRPREYLTENEIDRLIQAARKQGRHGHRDGTLILVAYRHGLRVSETIYLRWTQIDFSQALLHVRRVKRGNPGTHPLRNRELRWLRKLQRDYPACPYVFQSERGGPLSDSAVRRLVKRAGEVAKIGFPVHPHMLRHSTGFYLANHGHDTRSIQAYLGHRQIQHTVRYTELAASRFEAFWED